MELLAAERTVDDAPEVLRRIRRLLAHHRATGPPRPAWCEAFVTTGYAHYCTLLPTAFLDEEERRASGRSPCWGFLFGMESLALSLGCDRSQLELAVAQSHPEAPAKVALLWAARHQLGLLPLAELREAVRRAALPTRWWCPPFPQYLSGFVQALEPVPGLAPFVVEVMSSAFARLPDPVLLPWLPTLITTLRERRRSWCRCWCGRRGVRSPARWPLLDAGVPPWSASPAARRRRSVSATVSGPVGRLCWRPTRQSVGRRRRRCSVATAAGARWTPPPPPFHAGLTALLAAHPETVDAVAGLLAATPR